MNNNPTPTPTPTPTPIVEWDDRGLDYVLCVFTDDYSLECELAVVKNASGTNWYDLYVDGEWLTESVWSDGCKEFAEEFLAFLAQTN